LLAVSEIVDHNVVDARHALDQPAPRYFGGSCNAPYLCVIKNRIVERDFEIDCFAGAIEKIELNEREATARRSGSGLRTMRAPEESDSQCD
jgi:hypothetical protein